MICPKCAGSKKNVHANVLRIVGGADMIETFPCTLCVGKGDVSDALGERFNRGNRLKLSAKLTKLNVEEL